MKKNITKTLVIQILLLVIFNTCTSQGKSILQENLTKNKEIAVNRIDSLFNGYSYYNRLSGTVLIACGDSI